MMIHVLSRLYLNEHLTPKYSKLIRSAKEMKSTGAIVKVYSRNGIPMVVPDGQSAAVKIFSNGDLDKIRNKFEEKSSTRINLKESSNET